MSDPIEDTSTESHGIRPSSDYVLLKRPKYGETMRDGLWLPAQSRDAANEAEVLAIGPGRLHEGVWMPVHVKPGDKVILAHAAYQPINVDGTDLIIAKEGLIMARITKSDIILVNASPKKMYGLANDAYHDGD